MLDNLFVQNGSIDTFYELFAILAIAFFGMVLLCKIGSFIDGLPVKEKKVKEVKKEVKEVKVEKTKEIKKDEKVVADKAVAKVASTDTSAQNISASVTASASANSAVNSPYPYVNNTTPIIIHQYPNPNDNNYYGVNGCYSGGNYLYDRFVDRPTNDDCVPDRRISEVFISENESEKLKNSNSQINTISDSQSSDDKSKLYSRINQMTSNNMEKRERLLKEFEGLSKEMKLLLIDNIIQKM